MFKRGLVVVAVAAVAAFAGLGAWGLAVLLPGVAIAWFHARLWVRHTAYALTDVAIAYRSGWWQRRTSVVRFAKIQTVSLAQTPFDRRHEMARLSIDTAGAGKAGHKVHVPFLPLAVAVELHERLALEAAQRSFRW